MLTLTEKFQTARHLSWKIFGRQIVFHIPGMVRYEGIKGKYQSVSMTGGTCVLQCDHCKGRLLQSMVWATTPDVLVEKAIQLEKKGNHGILISGGCDSRGQLPWDRFLPAIREIKQTTALYVSIHSGILNDDTAQGLKKAGVDQALIDVVGDDDTYQRIYGLPFGVSKIVESMESIVRAGIDMVPHIVCGLDHGRMNGEKQAIDILSRFNLSQVVIVSIMALGSKWRRQFQMPGAEEVVGIIAEARLAMPSTAISLGCARERGNRLMETLAIDVGVNRMALPSENAIARANHYGLYMRFQPTCCSVNRSDPLNENNFVFSDTDYTNEKDVL